MTEPKLTPTERLARIAGIIDVAEQRCLVSDGPFSKIKDEITTSEMLKIYLLATGQWMARP